MCFHRANKGSKAQFRQARRRIGCVVVGVLAFWIASPTSQAQLRDLRKPEAWKYHPKRSFEYHPKRSWTYHPQPSWQYHPKRSWRYHAKRSWQYHPTQKWEHLSSINTQQHAYRITCTTSLIRDLVQQLTGERASVEGTAPDLDTLQNGYVSHSLRADVIFHNGLDVQGKVEETLKRFSRTRPVYAVTEAMAQSELLKLPGVEDRYDPHVWMDITVWKSFARMVGQRLSEFDPPNAGYYLANYTRYAEQLDRLQAYAQQVLGTIPEKSRILITDRPAFGYLARQYGLTALTIDDLQRELETNDEITEYLLERDVKAVFADHSGSSQKVMSLIDRAQAADHDMTLGGTLFSDATGAADTYEGAYIGMMDHNVTTIARALGGSAPERGLQGKLSASLTHQVMAEAGRP